MAMKTVSRRVAAISGACAIAALPGTGGSHAQAPDEAYVVSCDVHQTSDMSSINGPPPTTYAYDYKLKFHIDTKARAVTSMLGWHAKKGNYDETVFSDDVRVMSSTNIVFCLDAEHKCAPYEKVVRAGSAEGTVSGQFGVYILDPSSMKISQSSRMRISDRQQSLSEKSHLSGQCRRASS